MRADTVQRTAATPQRIELPRGGVYPPSGTAVFLGGGPGGCPHSALPPGCDYRPPMKKTTELSNTPPDVDVVAAANIT